MSGNTGKEKSVKSKVPPHDEKVILEELKKQLPKAAKTKGQPTESLPPIADADQS